MKIKNILLKIFIIGIIMSNAIISTSFYNIALSFEAEFDEQGFIINNPNDLVPDEVDFTIDGVDSEPVVSGDQNLGGLEANAIKGGELVSCTDYSKLGGVSIDVNSNQDIFEPGKDIIIQGDVTNNNTYPIVDATVYARLVKNLDNGDSSPNTSIIVDEFILASDINLNFGAVYTIDTTYRLPDTLAAGNYQMLLYVYNSNQFNIAGITFSNSFYDTSIPFSIGGDNQQMVYIDTNAITLNGQKYDEALIQNDPGEVKIEANLVNTSTEDKEIKVTYELYHWDSTFQDNIIQSNEEIYTINAGQRLPITYTLNNTIEPVYNLKITSKLNSENQNNSYQSIANIRFTTSGAVRPRLDFVGLDSYPITKDTRIITCIHNTSAEIDNGPIKSITTLKDSKGREMGSIEYNGPISSQIEGIASRVNAINFSKVVTLESVLYNNQGIEVDRVVVNYDCNKINPALCEQTNNNRLMRNNIIIGLVIFILVVAMVMFRWKYIRQYIIKNK